MQKIIFFTLIKNNPPEENAQNLAAKNEAPKNPANTENPSKNK